MGRPYVGFWWRFLAILIDAIIINALLGILAVGFGVSFTGGMETGPEVNGPAIGMVYLVALLAPIVYFAVMQGSPLQATIGKLVIGAIVTDLHGGRLSYGKSFLREICKIPSAVILYIGFIMAAFTARKQGLHDIMAGTFVIKKRLAHQAFAAGAPP